MEAGARRTMERILNLVLVDFYDNVLCNFIILLACTRDFVRVELIICNGDDKARQEFPLTYKLDKIFSHLCQHEKKTIWRYYYITW